MADLSIAEITHHHIARLHRSGKYRKAIEIAYLLGFHVPSLHYFRHSNLGLAIASSTLHQATDEISQAIHRNAASLGRSDDPVYDGIMQICRYGMLDRMHQELAFASTRRDICGPSATMSRFDRDIEIPYTRCPTGTPTWGPEIPKTLEDLPYWRFVV